MATLVDKLKELRKEHNYTQRQVASKIGVSQVYYSYIEKGTRNVNKDILTSLETLYNTSLSSELENYNRQKLADKFGISMNLQAVPIYNTKDSIVFDNRYLEYILEVKPENAVIIKSVSDNVGINDLILIDVSDTTIRNHSKYAIQLNNEVVIATGIADFHKGFYLSYNGRIYNTDVNILGKVIFKLNKGE